MSTAHRSQGLAARVGNRSKAADDGVLPLINVVFLVLIFLMIAATVTTPAPFRVEPPTAAAEPEWQAAGQRVAVGADGDIALAGARVTPAQLIRQLDREGQAAEAAAGQGAGVLLHADARAEAGAIIRLVRQLEQAGLGPVRVQLQPAGH